MKSAAVVVMSAVLGAGLFALSPSARATDDPVLQFRGAGSARDALDAMQLKPFDQKLWAELSGWNGKAPTPEDLSGKVVLIVTWSSWYRLTHPAMRTAERLYEKYKDSGLVVVGVHNPKMPEGAAENAKTLGVTFPFALDKEGKFRAALKADQDPNVYFIDRSGNLRYAQVDSSSMEQAAEALVKETAEQAAEAPKLLQSRLAQAEKNRWKTRDVSGPLPGEDPPVTFAEPDEDAYKKVRWPYRVGKVESDPIFEQMKNDPPKILNMPEEDWTPRKPNTAGKILVIYFVDPKEVDMLNAIPVMNRIHDRYLHDAVVICSLFKQGASNITGTNAGNNEDADKLKKRNADMIPTILQTRSVNHYINPTILKAENLDLGGGGMVPRWSGKREEYSFAILLSTDMKIRWIGTAFDQDLVVALEKLIAIDPAVQARRKAEDAKAKGR